MTNQSTPGTLFIISAPSGTGKTTLVKTLLEQVPGLTLSISHTTREKRPAEIGGINYHFVSQETFAHMVKENAFLEHATIFGKHYGTSRTFIEETLARGTDIILEIDWQGARRIRELFPPCIPIFILPPSFDTLKMRLHGRKQDAPEILAERIKDLHETLMHLEEYDYLVINDYFAHAITDLTAIIIATRLQRPRQMLRQQQLLKALSEQSAIL